MDNEPDKIGVLPYPFNVGGELFNWSMKRKKSWLIVETDTVSGEGFLGGVEATAGVFLENESGDLRRAREIELVEAAAGLELEEGGEGAAVEDSSHGMLFYQNKAEELNVRTF